MNRWKASGTHLLASALVVGIIAAWVLTVWYPPALLPMSGILGLIVLIAVVDVTLGPALTLAVFKPGKPGLKFDLAVIVALQVGMLGYGLYVLAQNRPVFVVASETRLNLVVANDLDPDDLADAPVQWQRLSWTGPVWVGTRPPQSSEEEQQLMFDWMGGKDIQLQPDYYTAFDETWPRLAARAQPLPALMARMNGRQVRRVHGVLAGANPEQWRYTIITNSSNGAALVLVRPDGTPGPFVAIDIDDVAGQSGVAAS